MRYVTTVDGIEHQVAIGGPRLVEIDGRAYTVDLESIDGGFQYSLLVGSASYEVYVEWCPDRQVCYVMIEGQRYEVRLAESRPGPAGQIRQAVPLTISEARVTSPMPGLVAAVLVQVGQQVRAGEGLLLLEAMKMENEIRAPMNGVVHEVAVAPGQRIAQSDLLVRIGLPPDEEKAPTPPVTDTEPGSEAKSAAP
jgi:biotin carboxyl carrier protein